MLEIVEWAAEAHSMWVLEPMRPELESYLYQLFAMWPSMSQVVSFL